MKRLSPYSFLFFCLAALGLLAPSCQPKHQAAEGENQQVADSLATLDSALLETDPEAYLYDPADYGFGAEQFTDALAKLKPGEVKEGEVLGLKVLEINEGNVYHPRVAPGAGFMAYAHVTVEGGKRVRRIKAFDLNMKDDNELLSAKNYPDFTPDKARLLNMNWANDSELAVDFLKGGEKIRVVVNVYGGLIARTDTLENETLPAGLDTLRLANTIRDAVRLYGDSLQKDEGQFKQALLPPAGGFLQPTALVLQWPGDEKDNDIYRLGQYTRKVDTLLRLNASPAYRYALKGGAAFRQGTLLALADGRQYHLLHHTQDTLQLLARGPSPNVRQAFQMLYQDDFRAVLFFRTAPRGGQGNNHLFVLTSRGLFRCTDTGKLAEASSDRNGSIIALTHWEGGERHLKVHLQNGDWAFE